MADPKDELIRFKVGKVICGRWKVREKLGSGGCGAVYEVEDTRRKGYLAALKVESNAIEDGGVLKLEAEVLRRLENRERCIRLIHSGKRVRYRLVASKPTESFSFIVITLCGSDLMALRHMKGNSKAKREPGCFSEPTILRIGVHCLYAIKQLHEVGYIHRDVKPGNMVVGCSGRDARTIFMIDYGMVRSFVIKDEKTGKLVLRKPRKRILLRGTLRYCSMNVHRRAEQGRVDDLWSLLYMLMELHTGLPWSKHHEEEKLQKMKETITDRELFEKAPAEFALIGAHLRTLDSTQRPDYKLIFDAFKTGMKRVDTDFTKLYDWEDENEPEMVTALSTSDRRGASRTPSEHQQLEWRLYPNTNPKRFEENILGF